MKMLSFPLGSNYFLYEIIAPPPKVRGKGDIPLQVNVSSYVAVLNPGKYIRIGLIFVIWHGPLQF